MKKVLLNILIVCIGAMIVIAGCKKMDSTYSQYVVPNGIKYAGKANGAVAFAGNTRVKIAWPRGADPLVKRAVVSWDNNADSVSVDYPATGDSISVVISGLEERTYSFIIKTYDAEGHASVPVELITKVYGSIYEEGLLNRPVTNGKIMASGTDVTITWGLANITDGASATEVKYLNTNGDSVTRQFSITETTSTLSGLKEGTYFKYRTLYKPDSLSIDYFYTPYQDFKNMALNKTVWNVVEFSDEHAEPGGGAAAVIDGTFTTRWHSQAIPSAAPYPHWVIVDMKSEYRFTQFGVERTNKDAPGGDNRGPDTFEVLLSPDKNTWTSLGVFNFDRHSNGEQLFTITSEAKGRYFKFVGLTGEGPYMVLGEISAYGF
ncbi:MAG: DUF4998 domain-containing protein [Niabella sp.]